MLQAISRALAGLLCALAVTSVAHAEEPVAEAPFYQRWWPTAV